MDIRHAPQRVEQTIAATVGVARSRPLRLLLWIMLGLLVVRPALTTPTLLVASDVLFLGGLLLVLRQLRISRMSALVAGALLFAAVATRLVDEASETSAATVAASLTTGAFVAFVLGLLLSFVVRSPEITQNSVLAAICVYILLGVVWGFAYQVVDELDPTAFNVNLGANAQTDSAVSEGALRYFSMMTLTTVGYGDIVPVSKEARALASLEALIAQIYLAAIVARIVGIEVANSVSRRDAERAR
ncbi:MAG: potassium channel family protein [Planctomycetota bacterium]